MRITNLMFRIFLGVLIVGVGFSILKAQEDPDKLNARIEVIDSKLLEIENQRKEIEMQLEEGPKEEDLKRALEGKLKDLRITRDSLIREREGLEERLKSIEKPKKVESNDRDKHDREGFWVLFKEPGVIAAAIGAVGIIVAALIGLLRRK